MSSYDRIDGIGKRDVSLKTFWILEKEVIITWALVFVIFAILLLCLVYDWLPNNVSTVGTVMTGIPAVVIFIYLVFKFWNRNQRHQFDNFGHPNWTYVFSDKDVEEAQRQQNSD